MLSCARHLSMCLNHIYHQRLLLTTPKPAPPSWAWNPPPQKVTWFGPSWSLSPSGGPDLRGLWSFKLRHVRVASFLSIFAETSSCMRRCWGKPTSPSQRSGRVLHQLTRMIKDSTCICRLVRWLRKSCYTQMLTSGLLTPDCSSCINDLKASADLQNCTCSAYSLNCWSLNVGIDWDPDKVVPNLEELLVPLVTSQRATHFKANFPSTTD